MQAKNICVENLFKNVSNVDCYNLVRGLLYKRECLERGHDHPHLQAMLQYQGSLLRNQRNYQMNQKHFLYQLYL